MADLDRLDDLLNSPAPGPVRSTPRLKRDLALLSREARGTTASRRRPTRVLVGAGLSLLLLGGAGTAVAATAFNWAPWAEAPDVDYPFTLPSGRSGEARVQMLLVTNVPESRPVETRYDEALTKHLRSFDVIAAADDALGDAMRTEATAYGLGLDQWSTNYSIQCEAVAE